MASALGGSRGGVTLASGAMVALSLVSVLSVVDTQSIFPKGLENNAPLV